MLAEATTLEFQMEPVTAGPGAVRSVGTLEESLAVQIIRMAFGSDPIARWVYPDPAFYMGIFPEFVRAFAGKAFENGTAYVARENAGAALWLQPGVGPDEEAVDRILDSTVAPSVQRDLAVVMRKMSESHPKEPHWYLPMIGVDPMRQGRGIGGTLMRYALERCDEEQLPAYLESSNPKNITLYQRCGFEVIGLIQAGSSPPMFPMLRRPRPYAF
jgi:ribosomal protein S18 acetylase RimI-like enzyme